MQFVAKTSTPGYTLLHFHTYNLSINTYTSNFPTSIISFQKTLWQSVIIIIIFCTSTWILLSCSMYHLNESMCTDFKEIKTYNSKISTFPAQTKTVFLLNFISWIYIMKKMCEHNISVLRKFCDNVLITKKKYAFYCIY